MASRTVTTEETLERIKPPITAVEGFASVDHQGRPEEGYRLALPHDRRGLHAAARQVVGAVGRRRRERAHDRTVGRDPVPTGIMRGFRNESADEAYMLAIVGGDDPGRVKWAGDVMQAVRDQGFDLDEQGKIVEVAR